MNAHAPRLLALLPVLFPLSGTLFYTRTLHAQTQLAEASSKESPAKAATAKPASVPVFYESPDPIDVTFTTNIGKIRGDKGTDRPWRSATISYKDVDGTAVSVPLKARTRGIWRLKMCDFPPLRLNFSGETSKGTLFSNLDKPKLVSYCQDRDSHEQYILQEFQLYRIYQLLTSTSHKARLLKFTYADSASGKVRARRYGFIIEEPSAIGARLGGTIRDQKGALPGDLDPFPDAIFGVFQYMIGNTDFSVYALHNAELFFSDSGGVSPIGYDFDFAGAINAGYATPDPSLNLPNVRRRLFRGYCVDPAEFAKAFTLFQQKKLEIYALYSDEIGKLMDSEVVRSTLKYYDEFYDVIGDPRAAKRQIVSACTQRPE
jgi:hypothetical protein